MADGISSTLNTAVSGMMSASKSTSLRANNIVNVNTPNFEGTQPHQVARNPGVSVVAKPGGPVSLSSEMIGLIQDELTMNSSVAVFKTADEMYQATLSLTK